LERAWGVNRKGLVSGSEAGSYLRLIDFVYHSTLGLRVIKKKKGCTERRVRENEHVLTLPDGCERVDRSHALH